MVDEDKLFDEEELDPADLEDDTDDDDLDLFDDEEEEDEDDLSPKHLDSLGFGIEEEEF